MCRQVCAARYVPPGMCHQVCATRFVPPGMCRQVCAARYVPPGMCHQVCAARYMPPGMCRQVCATRYVPPGMCHQAQEHESFFQYVHFLATALHLLQISVSEGEASSVTMLLWWADVSQAQTRAWEVEQGLSMKDRLLELRSAAASFLPERAGSGRRCGRPFSALGGNRCTESDRGSSDKCSGRAAGADKGRVGGVTEAIRGDKEGIGGDKGGTGGGKEIESYGFRIPEKEHEVLNVKGDLLAVKGELLGELVIVKEGLVAVKGELVAVRGELVTVKGQLLEQKECVWKLEKERAAMEAEVSGLRLAAGGQLAAVELCQAQTPRHEELDVEDQLRTSKGDVKSFWQVCKSAG
ncbi:unnamed protein product [Closterium sp. NIES-64]|nr:unnamed protein product [Closterium sp. NIES-64]